MRRKRLPAYIMTVAVAGLTGCMDVEEPAGEPGGAVGQGSSSMLVWVPISTISFDMVGRGLNGRSLTGVPLDGRSVVSVSLEDVQIPGRRPTDLRLDATVFDGFRAAGTSRGHRSLVGAIFTATLDDGSSLPLRIDAVDLSSGSRDAHYLYGVSYAHAEGWSPLCGTDDAGAPILAVPLEGVWDYGEGVAGGGSWIPDDRAFTLGCQGHVLAKCVAMGYRPWAEGRICDVVDGRARNCERTSLAPFHQACTRALRADYCGNGRSHTTDSVPVSTYDGVGIRGDTESWAFEAEWTADGARCLSQSRLPGPEFEPACLADLVDPACGDPARFDDRVTLLMTEVADDPDGIL